MWVIKWHSKAKGLTQGTLFQLHDKKQEHAGPAGEKRGSSFVELPGKDRLLLLPGDGTAKAWLRGHQGWAERGHLSSPKP